MNGFKLYSCKRTTFCKQVECYQCDEAFPNTQPEGTENNTAEWLLSKLLFTLRAGEWFSFAIASILRSKCGTCVINVTRFANIHNLKEQEITQLYGFYRNFCSHLLQVNGLIRTLILKHTLFCMRQEGYQCDQVSLNTHTEGIGNSAVEWPLPELLFTLRAGEWFSFALL